MVCVGGGALVGAWGKLRRLHCFKKTEFEDMHLKRL